MKTYSVSAFNGSGAQLARPTDAPLPAFSAGISSGQSDMNMKLGRKLGNAGLIDEPAGDFSLVLGNVWEWRCIDVDTVTSSAAYYGAATYGSGVKYGQTPGAGQLVYRATVEEIAPEIGSTAEGVSVLFSSPAKSLGYGYINSYTAAPLDPCAAAKEIVQTYCPGLTWNPKNPNTSGGSQFSLTFTACKVADALEALRLLAGLNWYWTVLADGSVRFAQSNLTTTDHTFVVGQHVESFKPTVSQYRRRTTVQAYGALGLKSLQVAADASPSDPRIEVLALPQVNQQSVLDQAAQTRLLELDRVNWRAQATIFDNNIAPGSLPAGVQRGYDIESIYPGQTCRFVYAGSSAPPQYGSGVTYGSGVKYGTAAQSGARAVFIIAGVQYSADRAQLELGERQANVLRKTAALQNQLIQRLSYA